MLPLFSSPVQMKLKLSLVCGNPCLQQRQGTKEVLSLPLLALFLPILCYGNISPCTDL